MPLLVHDYAAIDLPRLIESLGRLDDFDAFAADLEAWMMKGLFRPAAVRRSVRRRA